MAAPFRIKIPVSLPRFSLGVLSSSRQTGSYSATRGNQEKEDKESKKVIINHKTWTGSLLKIIKLHFDFLILFDNQPLDEQPHNEPGLSAHILFVLV